MTCKLNKMIVKLLTVMIALAVVFAFSTADSFAAAKVKAPGKVKGVSASAAGDTAVTVKWKKVKGAKGYAVYCGGEQVAKAPGGKTTSYVVTGLDPGTKYGFYVRAYKTSKVKKWLNTKTGKYQKKKPAKKYRGGSKKDVSYKYGKSSATVTAKTTGSKPVGRRNASGLDAETIRNEMLRQINAQRAAAGLSPLRLSPIVNDLAMIKARDMYNLGYFDHNSPTWGGGPEKEFDYFGVSGFRGENMAWGQTTINEVMDDWMNSPGHRSNILGAGYTHVGVAFYGGYWVQQFANDPIYWGCDNCGADLRYSTPDYITAAFSYTPAGSSTVQKSCRIDFEKCAGCNTCYYYEDSMDDLYAALDEWDGFVSEGESCLDYITWLNSSGSTIPCPFEFTVNASSIQAEGVDVYEEG